MVPWGLLIVLTVLTAPSFVSPVHKFRDLKALHKQSQQGGRWIARGMQAHQPRTGSSLVFGHSASEIPDLPRSDAGDCKKFDSRCDTGSESLQS